jgi:hypothetical protein
METESNTTSDAVKGSVLSVDETQFFSDPMGYLVAAKSGQRIIVLDRKGVVVMSLGWAAVHEDRVNPQLPVNSSLTSKSR